MDTEASKSLSFRKDLTLFICTIAALGFAESIVNAIFNNFLNERFMLSGLNRTFLELPRESGGFLVIFASAALYFLPNRRLAMFATIVGGIGLVCMGLFSITFHWMFVWLFLFSLGQHMFMPLNTAIAMELSFEGKTGARLGQLNAIRNTAVICGSFFILIGFKWFHFTFTSSFIIAAFFYILGAILLFTMKPGKAHPPKMHLKLHKEYRLYYWLSVLFGTRKQIFLTFAPWVLVTVYKQPTTTIATLLTIAGVSGIFFQPLLGKAVDTLGEKWVLTFEAVLLIFVCAGYGYAQNIFTPAIALIIAAACFIIDQLLMSVNMARSTYLKKIITNKDHLTPTLTMSITLDHIFSISIALIGGLIWAKFGYQAVFLGGAIIAVANFFAARMIKIPDQK